MNMGAMDRRGKFSPLSIRLCGAVVGSVGFFLIAYGRAIIGTALVGIGSVLIAAGEG